MAKGVEPQEDATIYVFDTSTLIELKPRIPTTRRKHAFAQLSEGVDSGIVIFPKQVFDELNRTSSPTADPVLEWAKQNKRIATRYGPCTDELKLVLRDPVAQRVLDPRKSGVEEADPHVLALGVHVRNLGYQVVVVTEESRDRPGKLSMATACGSLRLVRVSIENVLAEFGL